jgi:toxin YoeB
MEILWTQQGSDDFDYWQANDPKIASRVRKLIADIQTTPFAGLGKPEPLGHQWAGYWSRRITREHRLVYRVAGKPPALTIVQCRYHY